MRSFIAHEWDHSLPRESVEASIPHIGEADVRGTRSVGVQHVLRSLDHALHRDSRTLLDCQRMIRVNDKEVRTPPHPAA